MNTQANSRWRRLWGVPVLAALFAGMLALLLGPTSAVSPASAAESTLGNNWSLRKSPADNTWRSVTYGDGLFVAVSTDGTGNRIMTSPDGINWTTRTSPVDNTWRSVTYGNGLFVAVAISGTGDRIMTSPDGINWTVRQSPADNNWTAVTYSEDKGLFVAVASTGADTGTQAMVSANGIDWTLGVTPKGVNMSWNSIAYGNGMFMAVNATGGSTHAAMISYDGTNWTGVPKATTAFASGQFTITYGNNMFVMAGITTSNTASHFFYTTSDGITFTKRAIPTPTGDMNAYWFSMTYAEGKYVAVSSTGTGSRVITSPDGINWTYRDAAAQNNWFAVTYGNGMFVAVGGKGTDNRVMTSNKKFINQVRDANGNLTNIMQLVPPSGTTTIDAIDIIYNNWARINSDPPPPAPGTRWGIWAWKWADKTLTLANSNTIPINLATYQDAGSCTAIGMPAKDCPRPTPMGPLKPTKSLVFKANFRINGVWTGQTPNTDITRPAD